MLVIISYEDKFLLFLYLAKMAINIPTFKEIIIGTYNAEIN